jgi:hypothetical protein
MKSISLSQNQDLFLIGGSSSQRACVDAGQDLPKLVWTRFGQLVQHGIFLIANTAWDTGMEPHVITQVSQTHPWHGLDQVSERADESR